MLSFSVFSALTPLARVAIVATIAVILPCLVSPFFRKKGVFLWAEANLFALGLLAFCLHPAATLRASLVFGLFLLFTVCFFSPLLLWKQPPARRSTGEKGVAKPSRRLSEPVVERVVPLQEPPMPKSEVSDVQLRYAMEVIRKLKTKKLKESDKVEVEVIEKTLSVYSGKDVLSARESKTLNACLSTVLKMMSAYAL